MLTELLTNAPGLKDYPGRGTGKLNRELVDEIEDHNAIIRADLIKQFFGDRNVSSHVGPSMFWVYCDTLVDAELVRLVAKGLGYRNIKTIEPWSGDPENRQPDPKGAYAVDISASSELIIGDAAKSFLELLEPILQPVKDHIVFKYGHMNKLAVDFDDATVAEISKTHIDTYLNMHDGQVPITFHLSVEQTHRDVWRLNISAT